MSGKTSIEWTDRVWNPVAGCSKVSEGCRNCYAERMDRRFNAEWCEWKSPNAKQNVRLHSDRLDQPIRWRKPQRIFVNSVLDLFHEQVPDDYIDQVFGIMLACEYFENCHHTFQILTKRPERMRNYLTSTTPSELLQRWARSVEYTVHLDDGDVLLSEAVEGFCSSLWDEAGRSLTPDDKPWSHPENMFPLKSVWLGVSVENQQAAEERIPLLLQTPASVRFLSMEPLLGKVSFTKLAIIECPTCDDDKRWTNNPRPFVCHHCGNEQRVVSKIDWVVAGGESGPNARPMHPDWARSIRNQCVAVGVPFFFKSWGEWESMPNQPWEVEPKGNCQIINLEGGSGFHGAGAMWTKRVGKKKAGRMLDGRIWNEIPYVGQPELDVKGSC